MARISGCLNLGPGGVRTNDGSGVSGYISLLHFGGLEKARKIEMRMKMKASDGAKHLVTRDEVTRHVPIGLMLLVFWPDTESR